MLSGYDAVFAALLPLAGEDTAAFQARVFLPGETWEGYHARVAAAVAARGEELSQALMVELESREPVPLEPVAPHPSELAWAAALTTAERSTVRCPKAWTLAQEILGAAFPTSLRRRKLSNSDKGAGATVLNALCNAASAAELWIRSAESARIAARQRRYFETAHPPKPVPDSEKTSVALGLLRQGHGYFGIESDAMAAWRALDTAIDAARVLFGASDSDAV